jgi:hypothetical protein
VTIDCPSEVDPDPQIDYPAEEQFLFLKDGRPYRSIIDCGQLWTIFTPDPKDPEQADLGILIPERCHDLRWDRRHGKLKERAIIAVDAALQVLVGGGIRYEGNLPFHEGDVLMAKFPGMFGEIHEQRCLVVSSSAVDAIRMRMPRRGGYYYTQCTVVPLEPATEEDTGNEPGIAIVQVYPIGTGQSTKEVAMCQELYTLDWFARDTDRPVGRIRNEDMGIVREALRHYLGLPR